MARGGGPYNDPNVVRASRPDSNEYSVNQSIDGSIDPVGSGLGLGYHVACGIVFIE
jgi:hypothetical protein